MPEMDYSTNKIRIPSPLETIEHFSSDFDQVLIKRDDLIHPLVGGNKWRKLRGLLDISQNATLMTMGGAHSNHIAASAAFAKIINRKVRAYIRDTGEYDTPTLKFAKSQGMIIEMLDRTAYRDFRKNPPAQVGSIFIPEGGAGLYAQRGLDELSAELRNHVDAKTVVALAAGTGTTALRLIQALSPNCSFYVFPAGRRFGIQKMLKNELHINDFLECHFPSESSLPEFGKANKDVWNFIERFEKQFHIPLDPIYTGPMIRSLKENQEVRSMLDSYSRLIIYHSGGLQGRTAYQSKLQR